MTGHVPGLVPGLQCPNLHQRTLLLSCGCAILQSAWLVNPERVLSSLSTVEGAKSPRVGAHNWPPADEGFPVPVLLCSVVVAGRALWVALLLPRGGPRQQWPLDPHREGEGDLSFRS
jgi:hypothetical protein